MKMFERAGSVLRRPWTYLVKLLERRQELVPLEDDPVGEFLEKKEQGVLSEEEQPETEPAEPYTSQTAKVGGKNNATPRTEIVEAKAQAEAATSAEESVVVSSDGEKKGVVLVENEVSETTAVTKEEPKVEESVSKENAEKVKHRLEKSSKDANKDKNDDTDKLLDVFRSEDIVLDALGSISKELGDMSVYSLLEESKKIAETVKLKKERQ